MRILIKYSIFFLIVSYFLNSDFFERNYFFNEILSFIGFLFFLGTLAGSKKLTINLKSYGFWIFVFSIVCIFHLILSIPKKTNWYYFARNTVIFYSMFSYFLGYFFFNSFDKILLSVEKYFKYYVPSAFFLQNSLLARYSGPVLFVNSFKKVNFPALILLGVLILIHGIIYDALSIVVLAPILIFIFLCKDFKTFGFFAFLMVLSIASFMLYFQDNFLLYQSGEYKYFGNVKKVYESHVLLSLDDNTMWRFILWYRYLVERFPENVFGIGFGTPFLPYVPDVQTSHHDLDEVHAHVSGAHNSLITLYVRLGILGLLSIVVLCGKVFKDFYKLKASQPYNRHIRYYVIWFSIFVIGLFNLSLESPLRASIFWISLGFLSRIKNHRNSFISLK